MFADHIEPGCRLPEIVFPKRPKKRKKTGGRVRDYTVEIMRGFLILETLVHADKHSKSKTAAELFRYVKNRIGEYTQDAFKGDLNALTRLGFIFKSREGIEPRYFYNARNFIREGGAV